MKAYVWRESVYKNGFKCNKCNRQLGDPVSGMPMEVLEIKKMGAKWLVCPLCGNPVAYEMKPTKEMKNLSPGKHGHIGDWI